MHIYLPLLSYAKNKTISFRNLSLRASLGAGYRSEQQFYILLTLLANVFAFDSRVGGYGSMVHLHLFVLPFFTKQRLFLTTRSVIVLEKYQLEFVNLENS